MTGSWWRAGVGVVGVVLGTVVAKLLTVAVAAAETPIAGPQAQSAPKVATAAASPDTLAALQASARSSSRAYERLAELCDVVGSRFAGSPGLVRAGEWAEGVWRADGIETVRREEVAVPHWVRGRERLVMLAPLSQAQHGYQVRHSC